MVMQIIMALGVFKKLKMITAIDAGLYDNSLCKDDHKIKNDNYFQIQ